MIDKNSIDCKNIEDKEFWHIKNFEVINISKRNVIKFEGLDLTSDIWVNGIYLGRCENAFVEHEINVTRALEIGENQLVVRIDKGLELVKNKPLETMGLMWNNDQSYRVWMRKPQFVYSWDWTIWLSTIGIWKYVTLHCYDLRIEDVYVHSKISEKYDKAIINIDYEVNNESDDNVKL